MKLVYNDTGATPFWYWVNPKFPRDMMSQKFYSEPLALQWRGRVGHENFGDIEELTAEITELRAKLAALEGAELVLTFNFGTLVKVVFQDHALFEVDLSPQPYFQVCWASGWGGAYESEEDAIDESRSLCGYGRSIREVKPGDDEYKNPRYLSLTEQRIPLQAALNFLKD